MPDHDDHVRTFAAAVRGEPLAREQLGDLVSDDVVMIGPRGHWTGRDAVVVALGDPSASATLAAATWSEPHSDGDTATVRAALPPAAPIGGFDYRIRFDATGRIEHVEQQLLPPAPLEPTPLLLGDDLRDLLAGALANRTPPVVAYVASDGRPHLSLRATTQVLAADCLAMWIRDPTGGLLRGIESNPNVTIWYRDGERRVNYQFYGRAHRDDSQTVRDTVYEHSPEPERNADLGRRGVAVVVEIDRVEGSGPGGRILMVRDA